MSDRKTLVCCEYCKTMCENWYLYSDSGDESEAFPVCVKCWEVECNADDEDDTCTECNGRGRTMEGWPCDDCDGTGRCDL